MMNKLFLILILPVLVFAQSPAEYDFGRLFTTPRQRDRLNEIRTQRPQEEFDITLSPEILAEDPDDTPVNFPVSTIEINGLVYRTDGKNSAWVNQKSSMEGSIENQYTRVTEKDINTNNVRITLPDQQSQIELKVGQRYDVSSQKIIDIDERMTGPKNLLPSVTPPAEMNQNMAPPVPGGVPPPPIGAPMSE